ncbi:MAG: lamin tail domain-containing protein [Deltaproteobacteria bacterium]|nr:lamin tail domain-containing protein [Deltaproteobacteria bacterium]
MKKVILMLIVVFAFAGCTGNGSGSKAVVEDTSTGVFEKGDSDIKIISKSDTVENQDSEGEEDSVYEIETEEVKAADDETDTLMAIDTVFETDSDSAQSTDNETDSGTVHSSDSETDLITDSDTDTILDSCINGLLINEIDYDMDGVDNMEFIEIYNSFDCSVNLSDIALVLFNGFNMTEYKRYMLQDCLNYLLGKSFMVVGNSAVTSLLEVPNITISDGVIQNGPDGVALINVKTLEVIDSFCYESELSEVFLTGSDDSLNIMQGTISDILDSPGETESLGRYPDGFATGNFSDDWFLTVPTPGVENIKFIQ